MEPPANAVGLLARWLEASDMRRRLSDSSMDRKRATTAGNGCAELKYAASFRAFGRETNALNEARHLDARAHARAIKVTPRLYRCAGL
jgi:hypothetical protein